MTAMGSIADYPLLACELVKRALRRLLPGIPHDPAQPLGQPVQAVRAVVPISPRRGCRLHGGMAKVPLQRRGMT